MDYCHLVEEQGGLPDGSFEITGSKVKSFSPGEKNAPTFIMFPLMHILGF